MRLNCEERMERAQMSFLCFLRGRLFKRLDMAIVLESKVASYLMMSMPD